MPDRTEVAYFGAGPALLPTEVLENAASALINFENTGLGLAEHSHRSPHATEILNTAKADLAKYLDVPESYEILFMQAGGTGEFSATIYNLVAVWVERKKNQIIKEYGGIESEIAEDVWFSRLQKAVAEELKLDYLVTGSWSLKASQEAVRLLGPEHVNIAADSRKLNAGKFGTIPDESSWSLSTNPAMVYYCDNETVDGVEFPGFPTSLSPTENNELIVVADMSSNILSRKIPIQNFSIIFFGAQKNLGCTGITVVIIKKSLLPPNIATPPASLLRKLGLPIGPIVLSYETIAKNNSLYNTLSIFDVYIAGQVMKRLLDKYPNKVEGQERESNKKANLIYSALDAYPDTYHIVPDKRVRSRMNICFRVTYQQAGIDVSEKLFLQGAADLGLQGLKGHRSVGGIRASNYNSISLTQAEKLAAYINAFASTPKQL
ncbi:hypothetical protein K3495_g9846 [Podosphaera aphanis]|nr:hypothetical protein K3495_g9846 [Podosphaera aphanis]